MGFTETDQIRRKTEERALGGSLSYLLGLRSRFLFPWKLQGLTRLWSDIVICRHRSKEYQREGHKQRSFHLCEELLSDSVGKGDGIFSKSKRGEETDVYMTKLPSLYLV